MTLVNDHECCMAIEGCMAIQSHGTAHACAMTIGTLEQHPLAVHGPNRQLGSVSVFHDRHMMGDSNPLYIWADWLTM